MLVSRLLRAKLRVAVVMTLAIAALLHAQTPVGLEWSTYLGGNSTDRCGHRRGITRCPGGDVVIFGFTQSTNFPLAAAAQTMLSGQTDGYITRLASDGRSLVWSSYFGGNAIDAVYDVAIDASGVITICGMSSSSNLPGARNQLSGGNDAFIAQLSLSNGANPRLRVLWSLYVGGSADDCAYRLAMLPNGQALLAGYTQSPNLPMVAGAVQPAHGGARDGLVALIDTRVPSIVRTTYFGGAYDDSIDDMQLDAQGVPMIVGYTASALLPHITPNALQRSFGGGSHDGFFTCLAANLSSCSYSSFLGGNGCDQVTGVSQLPSGRLVLAGWTSSPNFPVTTGSLQTRPGGGNDGFVSWLDLRLPPPVQLRHSTYYGGPGSEGINSLATDAHGFVTAVGSTGSSLLQLSPGPHSAALGGSFDGFVVRMDESRKGPAQLRYASYLGGSSGNGWDHAYSVDVDDHGYAYVAGITGSSNFPTSTRARFPTPQSEYDTFVTKMRMLPQGVERYAKDTPCCTYPIAAGVEGWPKRGATTFALESYGAPPHSPGMLFLGVRSNAGFPLFNVQVFLARPSIVPRPAVSDGRGFAQAPITLIPPTMAPNTPFSAQWLFLSTPACPGSGLLGASQPLQMRVQ